MLVSHNGDVDYKDGAVSEDKALVERQNRSAVIWKPCSI